jgi:hypothetical protein
MNFIKYTLLFLNVCFVVGWSIQHWMTTESDAAVNFQFCMKGSNSLFCVCDTNMTDCIFRVSFNC